MVSVTSLTYQTIEKYIKTYKKLQKPMIMLKYMYFLIFFMKILTSELVLINSASPIVHLQPDYIQAGVRTFYTGQNDTVSTSFQFTSSYIIHLKRIPNIPGGYHTRYGFRGFNILFSLPSVGLVYHQISTFNFNSTSFQLQYTTNNQSHFGFVCINYLVVHNNFYSGQNIIVGDFVTTNASNKLFPGVGPDYHYIGYTLMPATGYKYYYSIYYMNIYTSTNYNTNPPMFSTSLETYNTTHVRLKVDVNYMYINSFKVQALFIPNHLYLTTLKKPLILIDIVYPLSTNTVLNFTIALSQNITKDSYFIGINYIKFNNLNVSYIFGENNVTNQIKGFKDFGLGFSGVAFYGYKCTDGYYLSDVEQKCKPCMKYCKVCSQFPVLYCHTCDLNFVPVLNNSACTCPIRLVSGVCDTFSNACDQGGCLSAERLPNDTIICHYCSFSKHLIVQNNKCVCKPGYQDPDSDSNCTQICGDGQVHYFQCDDHNTISGDGCSSSCQIQPGFICYNNPQPTYCQSLAVLRYSIGIILKDQQQPQAQIQLPLLTHPSLTPYPISTQNFMPQQNFIQLYIIISQNPLQQIKIENLQVTIDSSNTMHLFFNYQFTIQHLKARIVLDYRNTRYLNTTQELKFQLKGLNQLLIYETGLDAVKSLEGINTAIIIVCMLILLVGGFTPKFIGLQMILTLQLIYYSQLLVFDTDKWPEGFIFLKNLKYSSGYNEVFSFTYLVPFTNITKKMHNLHVKKTVLQNYNLSFIFLLVVFTGFLVTFILQYLRQKQLDDYNKARKSSPKETFQIISTKQLQIQILLYSNITQKAYNFVNYFAYWSMLPILCSVGAQILIENSYIHVLEKAKSNVLLIQQNTVAFITLSLIFIVALNNFKNIWINHIIFKNIKSKPQQQLYKRVLFIYLIIIGILIFFFNDQTLFSLPFSTYTLLIHVFYIILLIIIHPYKKCLKIHTIGLFLNQFVYLMFLISLNIINFVQQIDNNLILKLGYALSVSSGLLIITSIIRLYYQYRYGEALERQIIAQQKKIEQKQRQQITNKIKQKNNPLALLKQTQLTKIRKKNKFLIQSQLAQQNQLNLLQWLQQKHWDHEQKQQHYYQKYQQKPLDWLQRKNIKQYLKVKQQMKQIQEKRQQNRRRDIEDEYRKKQVNRLNKQDQVNKKILQKKLKRHQYKLQTDCTYAMNITKHQDHKLVTNIYQIKQ